MADESHQQVIPLSRFRAALARARRGRRADALLSEPDAEQLIPRLPVQELYYAIKEVGLDDARELVALASPEQVRGFLDLDVWERDHLDDGRMREWLDALVEAGPLKVKQAIEALDPEVVALYLQRQCKVYDLSLGDVPPEVPEGHYYPTPDSFFLLDVLPGGEAGKSLERLIDWLYRADLELARNVVMSAKWELGSDLEEHSYRWRSGRMADLGYADYYEALSVYAYLDPQSVTLEENTAEATPPPEPATLPVQLADAFDEKGLFARALATFTDLGEIERLQGLLMVLINKAMAADLVQPGDVAGAQQTLERAVSYLDLGLEFLARSGAAQEAGSVERAGRALRQVALERIFRVGVSLTLKLKRIADALGREGPGARLLDAPHDEIVLALRAPRPLYPRALDGETGTRPFRTLKDVARAAEALEEAARIGPVVLGGLGDGAGALAEAVRASTTPPEQVRFGTLARTAAGHVLLGRAPSFSPLHPRELRALAAAIDASAGERVEAAFRARLTERGLTPPPAFSRWLATWLGDLGTAATREGGLLVRYSWLK